MSIDTIDTIDLLESLYLHNTSHQGVTETPGPQRLKPAYSLQGEYTPFEQGRDRQISQYLLI
jgi:hypothetical protein